MKTSLVTFRIERFLDEVAAKVPAPGGGAVAAVVTAAAAGLAAMAARFSADSLADGAELAQEADRIRKRVSALADADAQAYGAVIEAYARRRSGGSADSAARREDIRSAMSYATEIPVQIAEFGGEVAGLAIRLLEAGNRHLAGDAYAAIALSAAAARAGAVLARINVHTGKLGDEFVNRADRVVRAVEGLERAAATLIHDRYSAEPSEV